MVDPALELYFKIINTLATCITARIFCERAVARVATPLKWERRPGFPPASRIGRVGRRDKAARGGVGAALSPHEREAPVLHLQGQSRQRHYLLPQLTCGSGTCL